MKMNNKGQGAMEYLMTYGWAILVVMIVGVVLWQLGVFNVGQGTVVPKDWNKLQPLVPTVAFQSSTDNFTASFNNVVGTSIRITGIATTESYGAENCTGYVDGKDQAGLTTAPETVGPGSSFQVNAVCSGTGVKNSGDQYLMTITVDYDAVVGGISTSHSETGTIRGNAE